MRSPAVPVRTTSTLALAASSVVASVSAAVATAYGPTAAYAEIFPPPWLALPAAMLAYAALALRRSGRSQRAGRVAWAAAVVFLGSSGGLVLDAFRGFFAVTGIPAGEFSTVDLPGAVARATALLTGMCAIRFAWAAGASTVAVAVGRRLRVLAIALCLPYPTLKLIWWLDDGVEVPFPLMEIVGFTLAAAWVLLLSGPSRARAHGRVVTLGGWSAALTMLSMGGLMAFGLLAQATHVAGARVELGSGGATSVVLGVYSSWLVLGALMLHLTLRFGTLTRQRAEVAA